MSDARQDHIDEEFGFLNACERRRKSRHFKRHSDSASRHSKTTNNGRKLFFPQFFSVFVESFLSFDCLLCHQSLLSSSRDLTYIPYSVFRRNLNFSQHNSPPTRFWLQLISIFLYDLDWQSSTSNCAMLTMWYNRNEIDLNDSFSVDINKVIKKTWRHNSNMENPEYKKNHRIQSKVTHERKRVTRWNWNSSASP